MEWAVYLLLRYSQIRTGSASPLHLKMYLVHEFKVDKELATPVSLYYAKQKAKDITTTVTYLNRQEQLVVAEQFKEPSTQQVTRHKITCSAKFLFGK